MNFKFESLNIHISHLTKLGMIIITLKCQYIYYSLKSQGLSRCFLALIKMFWSWTQKHIHLNMIKKLKMYMYKLLIVVCLERHCILFLILLFCIKISIFTFFFNDGLKFIGDSFTIVTTCQSFTWINYTIAC
jgi:hypothetical protein